MSDVFEDRQGGKVQWFGKRLHDEIERESVRRLYEATDRLRDRVLQLLAVRGDASSPSAPGEPPRQVTGELLQSIFSSVDETKLIGRVGTTLQLGLWLEFGTSGGQTVTAKNGTLSWIDPKTGKRVFARTVTLGRIYPRPFLRPALQEAPRLALPIFSRPMRLTGGGVYVAA